MSAAESILLGHPWPLAGREAEMTEITAVLDSGRARGVVLAGDPGTGKSRLLLEALARSRETAGSVVDCVVATKATASVPFAALSCLLPAAPRPAPESLEWWRYTAERVTGRAGGG